MLVVGVWAASTRWIFEWSGTDQNMRNAVCIYHGRVAATHTVYNYPEYETSWKTFNPPPLWRTRRIINSTSWRDLLGFTWPHVLQREDFVEFSGPCYRQTDISLPLWMLLPVIELPSLYLWRNNRRVAPGHCAACGYNLIGNVSGICPECGNAVPQAETKLKTDR